MSYNGAAQPYQVISHRAPHLRDQSFPLKDRPYCYVASPYPLSQDLRARPRSAPLTPPTEPTEPTGHQGDVGVVVEEPSLGAAYQGLLYPPP